MQAMGKQPKSIGKQDNKTPISASRELPFITETPLWSFKKLDDTYCKWQIKDDDVLKSLKSFEGLTWAQIMADPGSKKPGHGSKNHYVEVSELAREAQKRLTDLNLGSEDMLFSLRLGSKRRLYGILQNRWFEIIWYDTKHEIYKTKR